MGLDGILVSVTVPGQLRVLGMAPSPGLSKDPQSLALTYPRRIFDLVHLPVNNRWKAAGIWIK